MISMKSRFHKEKIEPPASSVKVARVYRLKGNQWNLTKDLLETGDLIT